MGNSGLLVYIFFNLMSSQEMFPELWKITGVVLIVSLNQPISGYSVLGQLIVPFSVSHNTLFTPLLQHRTHCHIIICLYYLSSPLDVELLESRDLESFIVNRPTSNSGEDPDQTWQWWYQVLIHIPEVYYIRQFSQIQLKFLWQQAIQGQMLSGELVFIECLLAALCSLSHSIIATPTKWQYLHPHFFILGWFSLNT